MARDQDLFEHFDVDKECTEGCFRRWGDRIQLPVGKLGMGIPDHPSM